jgi:pilus assembly protein Flp/PilA
MKNKNGSSLRNLLRATRGANMVEYIILVGIVALIAIAGFGFFGAAVRAKIKGQGDTVAKVIDQAAAAP